LRGSGRLRCGRFYDLFDACGVFLGDLSVPPRTDEAQCKPATKVNIEFFATAFAEETTF